jgi:predicted transcriptional regulator
MIVNLYKAKMAQQHNADGPKLKAKDIIKKISEESGIGQRTISVTLSEYRNKGSVKSPNKTKVRPTVTVSSAIIWMRVSYAFSRGAEYI